MVERAHSHQGRRGDEGDSQGIHVNGLVQSRSGALLAVHVILHIAFVWIVWYFHLTFVGNCKFQSHSGFEI